MHRALLWVRKVRSAMASSVAGGGAQMSGRVPNLPTFPVPNARNCYRALPLAYAAYVAAIQRLMM